MSLFDNYSDIVSIHDMMEMLCIGKNKAYELANTGVVKSFKIGNHIRVCKSSIIHFITSQQAAVLEQTKEDSENKNLCNL